MAKAKKPKTKKPSRHEKPKPIEGLTKEIPKIKEEVRSVKIDKHKREVLHELWPEVLMHQLSQAEMAVWRSVGTYRDGLTPQEIEALKEIRQNIKRELDKASVIYFRLKFWRG